MSSAKSQANTLIAANCLLIVAVSMVSCGYADRNNYESSGHRSLFAARRAADDSRPLTRLPSANHREQAAAASEAVPAIVMGKFKAPAPERIHRHRVPKSSNFGEQTMSASFRVADNNSENPEKIVNGVIGASALNKRTHTASQQTQRGPRERQVSAKMQVSDEGLNYPPSKLSADIHGNVAEIVTAPPEAVDSDFLAPQLSKLFGSRQP